MYSTFMYRAQLDKCLIQPVVTRSSTKPQFILPPTAPGVTQALFTQVHIFQLVWQTFVSKFSYTALVSVCHINGLHMC
jgi:hypothetical protein